MKLALVLSGGGVLGAGHIGTLEVLEDRGIRPDLVVGTSAGAIIGAIYASGGVDPVNEFIDTLYAAFSGPRAYLLSTPSKLFKFVGQTLVEYLAREQDNLRLPFYPVATNLRTGQYAILSDGDRVTAILASAAYPGVFPAQHIAGELYVDGGLTALLPSAAARNLGATYVIGSSIYSPPVIERAQMRKISFMKVVERSLDIMQAAMAGQQASLCDFCFIPPVLAAHQWYHFRSVLEIRELGRAAARDQVRRMPKLAGDR